MLKSLVFTYLFLFLCLTGVANSSDHPESSVLSGGNWYKISIDKTGIYKISYNDLIALGMDVNAINPAHIRIYGNGGGMLPEANENHRLNDLTENPVWVSGQDDGHFDSQDYIVFYGKGPDSWIPGTAGTFSHLKNLYADLAYYFITADLGPGKRVYTIENTLLPPTRTVNCFNDYAFYEKDDLNLIQSGRNWYDKDVFDVDNEYLYNFSFPDINTLSPVTLKVVVAARSTTTNSSFDLFVNQTKIATTPVPATTSGYLDDYAKVKSMLETFLPTTPDLSVKLVFRKPDYSAIGWLDYIEINAQRQLKFHGGQMPFRYLGSVGPGEVSQFVVEGSPSDIWDVSNIADIRSVHVVPSGHEVRFTLTTDTLHEFVAFDGNMFYSPVTMGKVGNQDLHGAAVSDFIIISHPSFLSAAERLAQFHRDRDGMSVVVTTPEQVFNEFSSGAQDVCAIRDYMRYLFKKSGPLQKPDYLLLFGDASYDPKNRMENNTNRIITYESRESLEPTATFATDDFFGLLDDNEGIDSHGAIDLGIGRFPVQTPAEAEAAVDKVIHYCTNAGGVMGDWRNTVCFVADDEDGHFHETQSEELATIVDTTYLNLNVDKIYLDAYPEIATPGGQRYPDVNEAINREIKKGALIVSYTGHGGEVGWAHERVLEVPDIQSWTNFDNMPVFITATCEFSRFDDPARISAGEWVFLNPQGGGIALLTTTRPTYSSSNFTLAKSFWKHAFIKSGEAYPTVGDLMRQTKSEAISYPNTLKFILLGDPAMKLAYPDYNIVTLTIEKGDYLKTKGETLDTLKALSIVKISGEIRDLSGNRMTGFNGTVYPSVFDKMSAVSTLGNNGQGTLTFEVRNKILYKGKVNVANGFFEFTFIVPKDIDYRFGPGKISYYAHNESFDAAGYDTGITIGGFNEGGIEDTRGPEIDLFMNDDHFVSGGITDQHPNLLAFLRDESGINTVGNGVGHDITLVLDEDTKNARVINDYYVADLGTYKSGSLAYPFFDLENGEHTLTLKAWDVFNNSSQSVIHFLVASSGEFALDHVMNYPNPFQSSTTFSFEHNQSEQNMEVNVNIFDIEGKPVKTLHAELYEGGYRVKEIQWDGTDDHGNKLQTGLYVYRIEATNELGMTAVRSSKLVVIK